MDLASPSHPIQPVCCIRPSSGIYSFVISYLSELHLLSSPFSNLFEHLDNLIASIRPRVPPSLLSTRCLAERSCHRFCTFASLPVAPSSRLFLSGESCVMIPWRACIYTLYPRYKLHPTTPNYTGDTRTLVDDSRIGAWGWICRWTIPKVCLVVVLPEPYFGALEHPKDPRLILRIAVSLPA